MAALGGEGTWRGIPDTRPDAGCQVFVCHFPGVIRRVTRAMPKQGSRRPGAGHSGATATACLPCSPLSRVVRSWFAINRASALLVPAQTFVQLSPHYMRKSGQNASVLRELWGDSLSAALLVALSAADCGICSCWQGRRREQGVSALKLIILISIFGTACQADPGIVQTHPNVAVDTSERSGAYKLRDTSVQVSGGSRDRYNREST